YCLQNDSPLWCDNSFGPRGALGNWPLSPCPNADGVAPISCHSKWRGTPGCDGNESSHRASRILRDHHELLVCGVGTAFWRRHRREMGASTEAGPGAGEFYRTALFCIAAFG